MGTVAPMSHQHLTTADHLLGSRTRARLLRIVLFQRDGRPWVRDLCRRVGTGTSSLRRELDLLCGIGLINMHREGGAAFFEPVQGHPLIEPLTQALAFADDYDDHGRLWREVWPWCSCANAGEGHTMLRMAEKHQREGASPMSAREAYDAVSTVISPVYLVGGSVRDALMDRPSCDFDFTTPLDPDAIEARVRAAGRRPYLVGKKFGTVAFKIGGRTVEVTTFRTETYPEDTRKPRVEFVSELAEDLSRRDFTINAMALAGDEIIDLFDGQIDLASRTIRAVGDAQQRFAEDPLRILRAARFSAELGFEVELQTVEAMRRLAHRILLVARERWVAELDKLLVGAEAASGLRLLAETGLLRYLLPELQLQVGYDQNSRFQDRTLFEHTLAVVEATPPDVTLRWAALLHDVAKPYMRVEKPGRSTYVLHDLLGAEIVERTAVYLKWGNKRREDVKRLVGEHMLAESPLREADDSAKPPLPEGAT
jgi:tRNA nucleotidyltransferase (CCA-adding enzyme)